MGALAPSYGLSDDGAPCATHQRSLASVWISETPRRCSSSGGTASHILPYKSKSRVCAFGIKPSW